jgi:hypothetical protein
MLSQRKPVSKPARIHIPPRVAAVMVWNYAKVRVLEQVKAVAFIILYLVGFQMLVLRTTPAHAVQIAGGLAMVVFGLTFFLEGLFLGLMPLGERVGVQLPQRSNIVVIVLFGLLLGVGATLAEPAIAALRVAGWNVTPWEAPSCIGFSRPSLRAWSWRLGRGSGSPWRSG